MTGRPVTIKKLRKLSAYSILPGVINLPGDGDLNGFKVLILVRGCHPGDYAMSVKLPVILPDDSTKFYVAPNYDQLGQRVKGTLMLLVYNSSGCPTKVVVSLRPWLQKATPISSLTGKIAV